MARPPRPRRQQREQQRALRKTVRQLDASPSSCPAARPSGRSTSPPRRSWRRKRARCPAFSARRWRWSSAATTPRRRPAACCASWRWSAGSATPRARSGFASGPAPTSMTRAATVRRRHRAPTGYGEQTSGAPRPRPAPSSPAPSPYRSSSPASNRRSPVRGESARGTATCRRPGRPPEAASPRWRRRRVRCRGCPQPGAPGPSAASIPSVTKWNVVPLSRPAARARWWVRTKTG